MDSIRKAYMTLPRYDIETGVKALKTFVDSSKAESVKHEREQVAARLDTECHFHGVYTKKRRDCPSCMFLLQESMAQGKAPTSTGEWPE